ncbi:MAG TPA: glycosyltransferase family 9 protein [Chloroflexota bacterium]|nr:glycosyltransferase family 9 protein [Chloroflexota bacterium]
MPRSLTPSRDDLAWLEATCSAELRRPILTIHPGSGSIRKNWPPVSFATLVNMARERLDFECAVIVGPADDGPVEELLPLLATSPRLVARSWPLGRVAALLSRSALYAGNDSGISHLAGCVGVRGVALFGPTDSRVWAPLGDTIHSISQPSMADHRPEDVFTALAELIAIH